MSRPDGQFAPFPVLVMSLLLSLSVILCTLCIGALDRVTHRRLSLRWRRPIRRFVLWTLNKCSAVMRFSNRMVQ